jgi:formyl-CoA transferase
MAESTNSSAAPLPLSGMRVLDVSQVMAGPFCSMLLGDLGADVIKVEPPDGGDQTRRAMGFKLKGDDSLGFLNMNRNKRSLTLDLKTEAGRRVFYRLAETADVIVENYRPGVMKKLGIDYETIRKINPRLVYASISGFGQTGPWADRPGFDLMAQAASGVMSITGHPDGPPAKSGVPVADIGCSLFSLYAILAAYIGRQKTGEGQHIDASLFEAGIAFAIWDISEFWGTGRIPQRIGTANRMAAPYQAVRAKDGYFVLGANNDRLWRRLLEAIDRPDLLDHPDYRTNSDRLGRRDALIAELEKTLVGEDRSFWVDKLLEAGVPAGAISDYGEVFESPHAKARDARITIEHPIEGAVPNIGFPVKLSSTPQRVRRHPPLLGEHNAEIFAELGIPDDEARLAVGGSP